VAGPGPLYETFEFSRLRVVLVVFLADFELKALFAGEERFKFESTQLLVAR